MSLRIVTHYRSDLPGGLPAVWEKRQTPSGLHVDLYMRDDAPATLVDCVRGALIRQHTCGSAWDDFTLPIPATAGMRMAVVT